MNNPYIEDLNDYDLMQSQAELNDPFASVIDSQQEDFIMLEDY